MKKRRTILMLIGYVMVAILGVEILMLIGSQRLNVDWSSLYITALFITWAVGSQVNRLK